MISGSGLIPSPHEIKQSEAELAALELPTPERTPDPQDYDRGLTLEYDIEFERERVEEQLRILAKNGGSEEMAIKLLKNMYLRKYHDSTNTDRRLHEIMLENQRLEDQVKELDSSNLELFNDAQKWQTTVNELRAAMDLTGEALPKDARKEEIEALESFQKLQERERKLKEKYDAREVKLAQLESQVATARKVIEEYKTKLATNDQMVDEWAEGQQEYTAWLSNENLRLRKQLNELNAFLAAQRTADFGRWEQLLPQFNMQARFLQDKTLASKTNQLTYGTVDVDMRDSISVDMAMEPLLDRHKPPFPVRMRRRMYKSKTKAKRAGSSTPRAARPVECSKGYLEKRAASTYLQYRDGSGKETVPTLRVKGHSDGLPKAFPRKRTRLQKSADMTKRMEAVSEVRRLPRLPRSLTVRVSAQAYTRRDDDELAKLMTEKWSLTEEEPPVEIKGKEDEVMAKLVAVTRTVEPFIPRPKTFSGPTYLPKESKPLSRNERQHWTKKTNKWTLGPEKKNIAAETATKHVRFARKVEYEPDWPAHRIYYEPRGGYTFSWSHATIAILLVLLFVSHLRPDEGRSWREANERPEDVVAKLRVSGHGEARVPVVDFEVGKWADVNVRALG
jgi:predicted  nucleic acid-binding Zn-ribbon protein